MGSEVGSLGEGFGARGTTIGFLARVCPHVGFQGTGASVGFATNAAEIHLAVVHPRSPCGSLTPHVERTEVVELGHGFVVGS